MNFMWTDEQKDSIRCRLESARRDGRLENLAALNWFKSEVLPEIEERRERDLAAAREVAEWLLAEQEWRHKGQIEDAFAQGQNDNEEWLEAAYQRGLSAARREVDADRARTGSTPETREKALGHALKWALGTAPGGNPEYVVDTARVFDSFITGADQ